MSFIKEKRYLDRIVNESSGLVDPRVEVDVFDAGGARRRVEHHGPVQAGVVGEVEVVLLLVVAGRVALTVLLVHQPACDVDTRQQLTCSRIFVLFFVDLMDLMDTVESGYIIQPPDRTKVADISGCMVKPVGPKSSSKRRLYCAKTTESDDVELLCGTALTRAALQELELVQDPEFFFPRQTRPFRWSHLGRMKHNH